MSQETKVVSSESESAASRGAHPTQLATPLISLLAWKQHGCVPKCIGGMAGLLEIHDQASVELPTDMLLFQEDHTYCPRCGDCSTLLLVVDIH